VNFKAWNQHEHAKVERRDSKKIFVTKVFLSIYIYIEPDQNTMSATLNFKYMILE